MAIASSRPEEAILSVTAWHSEFQDGPVFALAFHDRNIGKAMEFSDGF